MNDNIEDINISIDNCNHHLTHFDIANILFKIFKNKYRYIGNKKWEYYDQTNKAWVLDNKTLKLKSDIKNVVSEYFIQRSLYWHNKSTTDVHDISQEIHAKMMSVKMINATYKLKSDPFVNVVIKESQSFFDLHNVDD